MKSGDIRRIPGPELGQQSDFLLDVSDLFVVLVQIERFYGDDGIGRGMNALEDAAKGPFTNEVNDEVGNRRRNEGVFLETGFFSFCVASQCPPSTSWAWSRKGKRTLAHLCGFVACGTCHC